MRIKQAQLFFGASLAAALFVAGCGSGNAQPAEEKTEAPSKANGTELSAGENSKPAMPVVIAQGSRVDLMEYADPERYTVFDFTSEYCGPCRQIAPYLDKLHAGREDVTVVKVDINRPGVRGIDFRSPVAQQYGIMGVPHFKVYDPEGTKIAEGSPPQGPGWQLVVKWIMELPEFANQAQG